MDKELVHEYLRRFDQAFSLLKNGNEASVWCIDLSAEDLRKHQQDFADRMLQEKSLETDVFSSGALIFYGYRLGVVQLKGKNECFTRQGGYRDNAIWAYNLDEILGVETEEDNPDAGASHIIEWITNPKSNTDVAEAVVEKMIIPLVKNLCKITPPGKRAECMVVMPPISKEIEIQDWSDLFIGVKEKELQVNIVNYGQLLTLSEDERQYILLHQTDGFREYVVVSAYEVIRGHNTCVGCLAFDVNDFDRQYILQDIKPVSLAIDNRQKRYEKKEKIEQKNAWSSLTCKYPVNSGFNSFLGSHAASFGRTLYKPSGIEDNSHSEVEAVKAVFRRNEALQIVEACSRLMGEQNLYNIALGDLVYVANILQRNKSFKMVSIETSKSKNYKLGTYKQFATFVDINKLSSIPSNYNSFSWKIKDKHKKIIPYFNLNAKTHTEKQIIESVVDHFEHCSAEIVADELLYLFKNGEDPCALFVAKVFMYMSQMDSLEIESRNEIITSIENVDDVVYHEIDKSHIHVSHPKKTGQQQSIFASQRTNTRKLEMTIEELDLTVRAYNCLKRARINTVKDIVTRSPADLLKIRNLGTANRDEVMEKIHQLGLKLSGE